MFDGFFFGSEKVSSQKSRDRPRLCRSPSCIWIVLIVAIFGVEYGLMRLLPRWTGRGDTPEFEIALIDAVSLVAVIAPLIWLTLVRPLRSALQQRIRLTDQLFSELERERRRIAHDLHDGIGQSLSLIVSGLRSLADVAAGEERSQRSGELQQLAHRTLVDVKELAFTLRPGVLDDLGLVPAIERIARQVQEHQGIEVRCELAALENQRMPEHIETTAFRIIQESLNNAARHAACSRVDIRAQFDGLMLFLQIEDDGRGIDDSKSARTGEGGLGIVGMHERAALLGGSVEVESAAGTGTKVTAELPVFRVESRTTGNRLVKRRVSSKAEDFDGRISATSNDDAPLAGEHR